VKIAGTAVLHAPADRVWAALNDPAVLARTIPGCSALEPNGPDRYRMTVTAGVASIKGVYSGEVALHDQQPPGSFRLRASGAGAPGTVRADVLVRLEDAADGTTALTYDADAVVGGMVGGVGQRMLTGVAKKTAGEFFKAVDGVLNGAEAPPAAAADAALAPAGAAVVPAVSAAPASSGAGVVPAVARTPAPQSGAGFVAGAVVGAAAALLGVVVGAVVARRR
jgi:hypothetical protein